MISTIILRAIGYSLLVLFLGLLGGSMGFTSVNGQQLSEGDLTRAELRRARAMVTRQLGPLTSQPIDKQAAGTSR